MSRVFSVLLLATFAAVARGQSPFDSLHFRSIGPAVTGAGIRGPYVSPGTYVVTLHVDGDTTSRSMLAAAKTEIEAIEKQLAASGNP